MIQLVPPAIDLIAICDRCGKKTEYTIRSRRFDSSHEYPLPDGWKKVIASYSQEGYPYFSDVCPTCIQIEEDAHPEWKASREALAKAMEDMVQ